MSGPATPLNGQKRAQAQGCAPPPEVAELREKTTLFARSTLGRAWMPGSSVFKLMDRRAQRPGYFVGNVLLDPQLVTFRAIVGLGPGDIAIRRAYQPRRDP
jgi:hypothetical protein